MSKELINFSLLRNSLGKYFRLRENKVQSHSLFEITISFLFVSIYIYKEYNKINIHIQQVAIISRSNQSGNF